VLIPRRLLLWDWASGAIQREWAAHPKAVQRTAWLPESGRAVSGCRDGTVRVWSREQDGPVAELKGHTLTVNGVATLEDLNKVVSGSRDYSVRVWDLERCELVTLATVSRNVVTFVRRIPGEAAVAQAGEDLQLRVWDVRTMQCAQAFLGHVNIPTCCDAAADGGACCWACPI
jgi:WD40 repeat protein